MSKFHFIEYPKRKPLSGSLAKRWYHFWRLVESLGFRGDHELTKANIRANYQRSYSPGGTLRQLQAILATGCLKQYLCKIDAPTLIIHGEKDPLLRPACGVAIAKKIPQAKMVKIKGMGHDLPDKLMPTIVTLICQNTKQAGSGLPSERIYPVTQGLTQRV